MLSSRHDAPKNSEQDTPDAALQALVFSIVEQGKPATFAGLCDAVDRGPSRVIKAIRALRASGYNVRVAGMRSFAC